MCSIPLCRAACLAALLSLATFADAQNAAPPATDKAGPLHVTSSDGTRIAFDKSGAGPALILVGGALSDRKGVAELAQLLAPQFTVYSYDRRGRGDSTDNQPYSVQREIEDLEALIDGAGGSALVYGKSSGASLSLRAAATLGKKIRKLALYEPPYNESEGAAKRLAGFTAKLDELLAAGRRAEAVTLFLQYVGMPADALAKLQASPAWAGMTALAPTLAYDNAVVGVGGAVPVDMAARIKVPTLVMDGGASLGPMPFMRTTADKLGRTIPGAQRLVVEGQAHDVSAKALAPILQKFFQR
jgi:pimeloyl-ACP methyl ester carboxylesterase